MLYRELGHTGDSVSILGYGCMRFPRKNGRIDEERTGLQIAAAVEGGVNYFDTAYIYPGSEAALGRILAGRGLRDKVYIATKLPVFMTRSQKDMENTLRTSLERLQTDHIDYYLMHNLSGMAVWERLLDMGVTDFLKRARESGRARRIGFSFHGDRAEFPRIVDAYPWDFCQIQYNYLDENFQAGSEGLRYAAGKGLGVVVMEPLRGGLLSGRVPQAVRETWDRAGTKRTSAEWALRWVWNHPEVATLLSGMNDEAHIEENLRIAGDAAPGSLSAADLAMVEEAKNVYARLNKVGCTGCGYCMPCPAGVNIPACFRNYNDRFLFDDKGARSKYATSLIGLIDGNGPAFASRCKDCGKCEAHCPQHLPIRTHLKEVAGEMEGFYLKPLTGMVGAFMKLRRPRRKKREAE